MRTPSIVVVVLNWNGGVETLQCLESLARARCPNCSVLVVDNGSTDDSLTKVWAAYPWVQTIETGENLGYAGGNNVGIKYALDEGADYIVILNNDAVVKPDAIEKAVRVAEMLGDSVGVVGFATYYYAEPDTLHCLGLNAGLHGGFYVPSVAKMEESEFLHIGSAYGCAMLLTRGLLEAVGLFDERFFLMHEELDLCARAQRAGFAIVGATGARVLHRGSASFGGLESPLRLFYLVRNWPLYARKRFAEQGTPELLAAYTDQYSTSVREDALGHLSGMRWRHAFAVLAAARCARNERWGERQIQWGVRLSVLMDMARLLGGAVVMAGWRQAIRRLFKYGGRQE